MPALRTEPRLLQYLPPDAMVYGAVPNLGGTIDQAMTLAEQQSADSPAFRAWWDSNAGLELKQLVGRIQTVTPLLGTEIVGRNHDPFTVMEQFRDRPPLGWYSQPVTIHWTCTDALSGIAGSCPTDSVLNAEGVGVTADVDRPIWTNNRGRKVSGIPHDRPPLETSRRANSGKASYPDDVDRPV